MAAFYCRPDEIPDEALAGDTFASGWWQEHEREAGVGNTPDEALADLRRKRHA